MYDRADVPATSMPRQPIRTALGYALEQLGRCETLALELRAHITNDNGPSAGTLSKPPQGVSTPGAGPGSNEIAQRLSALGDMLSDLCSSF